MEQVTAVLPDNTIRDLEDLLAKSKLCRQFSWKPKLESVNPNVSITELEASYTKVIGEHLVNIHIEIVHENSRAGLRLFVSFKCGLRGAKNGPYLSEVTKQSAATVDTVYVEMQNLLNVVEQKLKHEKTLVKYGIRLCKERLKLIPAKKLVAAPMKISSTQLRDLWNKKLGEGDTDLKKLEHYTQQLFEAYRTDMKFCGIAPFIADLTYLINRRSVNVNTKDLRDIETQIDKVSENLIKFYVKYNIPYMLHYVRATDDWVNAPTIKDKLKNDDDQTLNQLRHFMRNRNQYTQQLRRLGISTQPRFTSNSHLNAAWNMFRPVVETIMKRYRLVEDDLPKTLNERKL